MHLYVYIYIHSHIYINKYTHTHIHTYTHTSILCVCVCVCKYIIYILYISLCQCESSSSWVSNHWNKVSPQNPHTCSSKTLTRWRWLRSSSWSSDTVSRRARICCLRSSFSWSQYDTSSVQRNMSGQRWSSSWGSVAMSRHMPSSRTWLLYSPHWAVLTWCVCSEWSSSLALVARNSTVSKRGARGLPSMWSLRLTPLPTLLEGPWGRRPGYKLSDLQSQVLRRTCHTGTLSRCQSPIRFLMHGCNSPENKIIKKN